MRSMYKAAHQICQNTLTVLLDTVIMTNDILILNKRDLMWDTLLFHKWPKDPRLADVWHKQIVKSGSDTFHPTPGAQCTFVCSNHFLLGKKHPKQSCNGLSFCFF